MDGLDTLSGPSFSYDGPFDPGGGGGGGSDEGFGSMTLSTDTTSVELGDTFEVEISLDSDGELVESFDLEVQYDPTLLTIQDADTSTPGTQIGFIYSYYTATTNTVSEEDIGEVNLTAEAGADPQAINTRVARVTFRAVGNGLANINLTNSGNEIVNNNGSDILQEITGNISVQIGAQQQSSSSSTSSSSTYTYTPSSTSSTSTYPYTSSASTLSPTGIFDSFSVIGSIIAGFVLIYIGVKAIVQKNRDKFWENE